MKPRYLIALGAVAFIWAVLMKAPAASLYAWLGPKDAQVQLYGLQGSLGQGSATALGYNGQPLLRDLHWGFRPLWLPLLRAVFHVDGGGEQLKLDGRVAFVFGGVNLGAVHAHGGVKPVLGLGGLTFAPVDGQVQLDLDSAKLRDGLPVAAAGKAEVRGLAWTLAKDPLPLGDFNAEINTADGVITAKLSSPSGPLEATGEAHLKADHSYDYDLRLRAKATTDPTVRALLDSMGQPDAQGYHRLNASGRLAAS